ncbi:unnamed protein product [Aureobasidium uvarum]|uniref:Zn(2)-C6 fungal-type domain-containing protein n=1 Tax=Aureobasidium uvarum TaxID=2773716 RepID=A0A9N8KKG9_9PEZI|nr:unnamed protein product [Aureobasidium uvarum]
MSDPKSTGGSGSKSRMGCSECKRKRVKCDEGKPSCGRCKRYPERCSYELKLSWTQGRPFKKPRTKEPWVTNLGASVATPSSSAAQSAPAQVQEETDRESSTTESSLSLLPDVSPNSENAVSSALSDSTGFNDYQDSLLISEDDLLTGTDLLDIPSDLDYEPADETIERDFSLVPYQHYSPPKKPDAYFFLHHYITHTSLTLFPLMAPSIHQEVLTVAAQTPHLLSAALALSCDQVRRLRGNRSIELQNRASFFLRKAITGLRKAMNDPTEASNFSTICTVLFLCTNEVMAGNTMAMRTHLHGAENLLSIALGKNRHEAVTDLDDKKLFLVRWFAVVDIFASIMSLDKTTSSDGHFWNIGAPSGTSSPQHIDEFVGFSLELMPVLARIGRMARLQRRRKVLGSSLGSGYAEMADDLDMLLADNILLTEQQLSLLFTRASSPSLLHTQDPVLVDEAVYVHQMFVHAALLHLYRRVQELPELDPKPAIALASMLDLLGKLRPESPANVLILWPLFTAGCEAEDPELRNYIEACMGRIRNYGWGNADAASAALRAYWDESNGERWDVFLERRGFDVVLF